MGVVIRRWVWLKCIGVISGCFYWVPKLHKTPYGTKLLLIPTPLVFALFCSSILTSLFILKCFFIVIFVEYSKHCSMNIRDRSKMEITPTWRYNYIDKHVDYESRDLHMQGTSDVLQKL